MRKERSFGDQTFPVIRQFINNVIRMLDKGTVWVTEDGAHVANTHRGEFRAVVVYHFIVPHQPKGARRPVRHVIAVDLKADTVTVDSDVLRMGMINPDLFERLKNACAERCGAQERKVTPSGEATRTLRRLTREFDRNFRPYQRLATRLGRHGPRIACGRRTRPSRRT